MNKAKLTHAETRQLTQELAALLGEKNHGVKFQIRRIIQLCGVDFAREMYAAATEIESNGGMMLPDHSRRRTPGGVFFHLVRAKLDEDQKKQVFSNRAKAGIPLFSWKKRIAITEALQAGTGTVKSLTVSLRGRPEHIEKRTEFVVITLSDETSIENIPRGIPKPPSPSAKVVVYIALEQWRTVEAAIATASDRLLVEGICAVDAETKSMIVFATSIQAEPLAAKKPQKIKSNTGALI